MFRKLIYISQNAIQASILLSLDLYRLLISPILGSNCRFYPSCSIYAREAFVLHGIWKGFVLTLRRLGRCHPYHCGGYDPVPEHKDGLS
jgi:putative membrane protein insertion efficiency factor